MGIELVLTGLAVVTSVVGGVAAANSAANSAREQREARDISSAQDRVRAMEDRRARIREERMRRARIIAQSENQGTGSSSGALGSVGALSTNLAGLIGSSLGEARANTAINQHTQAAADYSAQADSITNWSNTIQGGLNSFKSVFDT